MLYKTRQNLTLISNGHSFVKQTKRSLSILNNTSLVQYTSQTKHRNKESENY